MRRIIYLVHISVDGFISGPAGEFDWPRMGPELSGYVDEIDEGVDTFLYGRVVWEQMAAFWPHAEEIVDDPHVRKFAPRWRAMPKVVVSRTLAQPEDGAVRVLRGEAVEEVAALKAEPGRDILLTGGTELASHLAAAGLLDEWVIAVHPVVLGGGPRLFTHHEERGALVLVDVRTLDGRVALLRYAAA
jgi:dihydrofolate reductase